MDNNTPLYNSRVTKIYLEYLNHSYPDINIDKILAHAHITPDEVNDQTHWFSQNQVDLFQEAIVRETNNAEIDREAGRYTFASEALGVVKHYILGLLNLSSFYLLISKIHSLFSRGVLITAIKKGPNQVEIITIPHAGVAEKPYQCLNRIGFFESSARLFMPGLAHVEHTECWHKGANSCRYIISWEKSRSYLFNQIKNYTFFAAVLFSVLSFIFFNIKVGCIATLCFAFITLFLFFLTKHIQYEELKNTAEKQGNLAKDLLDEMTIRHNNAVLIQEIGQVTSSILDIDELIKAVIKSMETHMDFDRGLVMLANEGRTRLAFKAGFGYQKEKEDLLRKTEFNLTNPDSKGAFVLAYKNQEPFLINNVCEIANKLSAKSLQFAREMGAASVICVPIYYEKESLGILTVDNIKSKRPLSKSDLNVISGVASQMAISINNALSYKKLKQSEEKYRELVENANSIIMRMDINGRITFFNEFAQHFFMYAEQEILGKHHQEMLFQGHDVRNSNFQRLITTFRNDPLKQVIIEDEAILKSGEKVWITWTNKPIFDAMGDIKEILSIGNDITELKKAEIDKKNLEARLQRAEKMEAIGTLAGGVAHDLNNILSGIVSYPELLLLDLPEDSKLRKPISTIQKAGERAAAIVQDLLTLARRGVVARNVINLNDIVLDYLKSPEHDNLRHHHPRVNISTKLESTLFNILGSGIHLTKTLMNLVINAAEAIGDEGQITIATTNCHVNKNIFAYEQIKQGDYSILSVSDTGMGISEQDLNRIFEPFYTKKIMGKSGTGLGMAVVWGTIKDHNAFIDVKSVEGLGTTFTLFFPITDQIHQSVDNACTFAEYKGKGERILVVDDMEEQREITSRMLSRLGYAPISVASGEEAVLHLKSNAVDLIVLDMILEKGMDGLDTYRMILETKPHQKAIITSGFSETDRVKETQKLGAVHYLKKPYVLEQLGKTIREELDR